MGLKSGIIIPFQYKNVKKLLMIGGPTEERDLTLSDLRTAVWAAFGVYEFEFRNKQIDFHIPDQLLLKYLEQCSDICNFVIEIVEVREANAIIPISHNLHIKEVHSEALQKTIVSSPPQAVEEELPVSSPQPTSSTSSTEPQAQVIYKKKRKRPYETKTTLFSHEPGQDKCFESVFETIEGKIIVNNYKKSHRLQEEDRRSLARLIISKEFEITESLKISRERLQSLTNLICTKFPSEIPEIYFIPYSPITKRSARGKLWECYNNSKRRFNNSAKRHLGEPYEKEVIPFDDNVQFLLENDKPWEKVMQLWEKTFEYRRSELENGDSVVEYCNKYPALKLSRGYKLLEKDFFRIYSESNTLIERWDMIRDKVIEEATIKVKHPIDKILKEYKNDRTMCALMVMPYLLLLSKRTTVNFLPTNPENIIVHLSQVDPNEKLHEQFSSFHQADNELEPRVFVVGESPDRYTSYIVLDQTIYSADSPLKAVDLCFKCFHALNINYPVRQHQSWVLLQRVAYGITMEGDTPNTTLSALLADVFV